MHIRLNKSAIQEVQNRDFTVYNFALLHFLVCGCLMVRNSLRRVIIRQITHLPCHPHLVHTGQDHTNLPIWIRGDGGEGVPHDGEKGPAPCHHLFNERKITPLALSCNHGDYGIVFHMYKNR